MRGTSLYDRIRSGPATWKDERNVRSGMIDEPT
jgi:hypothetical protein